MVIEDIRAIKSGKKELRQFGITISVALSLAGGWLLWQESQWHVFFFLASGVFLISGIFLPLLLKPFQKLWMTLALLMGWVVTGAIMMLLFYLVVTPIGLLLRLGGRDLLSRRFDRGAESYWIPRQGIARTKEDYERQY